MVLVFYKLYKKSSELDFYPFEAYIYEAGRELKTFHIGNTEA